MKLKKKGKNIGKKVLAVCAVIVLVVAVECCFNTKNYEDTPESGEDTVATEKGLELSDYIGMTEDEFLKAAGFEKNDLGMYPEEHIAVICIDGQVNSLMINQFDAENTFQGYTIGTTLEELKDLTSEYSFIGKSEVEGGTRNMYMDNVHNALVAIDVDDQNKVFGIAYVLSDMEDSIPDTEEITAGMEDVTDTATVETTSGLQNVSAELSVLEENGFDTSILTTEEQVIVSYAKFIAISSAGMDQDIPVKTMRDIENEIYEYGFASDLVDYNSYGILNYYINCGIYQGLTTTAAEIIDDQYNIGDGWTVMEQVDYELDAEHM